MKILVTGGAGFIASQVVDAYIEAGHDVHIVDNLTTGRQRNVNPAATFHKMDLRDASALEELIAREQPEVINHHAAQIDVRRSVADPVYDAEVNVLGSLRLLEAARRHNVNKIIYISSGGACYGEPLYLPCDEEHPVQPLSGYGVSKHTVEHYLFLYRENYGLDYTVLRYGNVYGPRQDPLGEAGVVAIFSYQLLRGEPAAIYGSGEQARDFVFVGDCVAANVQVLQLGGGRIFNIGSGEEISINRLFRTMSSIVGYPGEPRYEAAKVGETFRIFLDISRARAELGWEPRVSLEQGLRQTIEALQAEM